MQRRAAIRHVGTLVTAYHRRQSIRTYHCSLKARVIWSDMGLTR